MLQLSYLNFLFNECTHDDYNVDDDDDDNDDDDSDLPVLQLFDLIEVSGINAPMMMMMMLQS